MLRAASLEPLLLLGEGPMLRSILPCCRDDESAIDRYQCSSCAWVYRFEKPQTFVNDEQVKQPRTLSVGDVVRVGHEQVVFHDNPNYQA